MGSAEHVLRIQQMAAEQKTCREIAGVLGLSEGYVGTLAKEHQIRITDPRRRQTEVMATIQKLAQEGRSVAHIATVLNVKERYVRQLASTVGITWVHQNVARRQHRVSEIRRLAGDGFRARQIAAQLSCSQTVVRELARQEAITLPDAQLGRTRIRLDVQRVIGATVDMVASHTKDLTVHGELDLSNIGVDVAKEWCSLLDESIHSLRKLNKRLREHQYGKVEQSGPEVEVRHNGSGAGQDESVGCGAEEVRPIVG